MNILKGSMMVWLNLFQPKTICLPKLITDSMARVTASTTRNIDQNGLCSVNGLIELGLAVEDKPP